MNIDEALPGEQVLWQGRPMWRAMARDVLHVRLVALWFALWFIWHAASDRLDGLGGADALRQGVPQIAMGVVLTGACALFAWLCARTTTYTITTERCVLRYGVALPVTLSLPLRRVASVSVSVQPDGTGTIPLTMKPGRRLGLVKLWPHVRPGAWRPSPALRCVPDAAVVAGLLARAAAAAAPASVRAPPVIAQAA